MTRFVLLFLFATSSFSFAQKKVNLHYNKILEEGYRPFSDQEYNLVRDKEFDLTIADLHELRHISQENKNRLMEVYCLEYLSYKYQKLYKIDKAIENTLLIVSLVNGMKSDKTYKKILIHAYNVLGVCYRIKYDSQRSINYHNKALEVTSEYDVQDDDILKNITIARISIAEIYRKLQQYELSIKQLNSAIEINKRINNFKGLAISYTCKGKCYEGLKDIDKALDFFKDALHIEYELRSAKGQLICNDRIANCYLKKGQLAKKQNNVLRYYRKALIQAEINIQKIDVVNDQNRSAKVIGTLGLSQKYLNKLDIAEINLKKSCEIYEEIGFKDMNYINNCYELSDLYEKKELFVESLAYLKKAAVDEQKIFRDQNIMYISGLISKFSNQANEIKLQHLEEITKEKEFEASKSRNILIITLITLALLGVALYSIYRQEALNNEKKVLRLKQKALQAQMNPHFIFNALNSIKLYIINNDQRKAVYYLNKFSKLIRNILVSSTKREISLAEELDTMHLYVTIENIRFNNEIVYECIIENKELPKDRIKVPPLILQPFIENAIWHGLSSKVDNKKITLIVSAKSDDLIEIRIKDTGVGRKQAMSIKQSKTIERQSVGVDLTKERLRTFSTDFNSESYIEYIDNIDDNGVSLGTEVVLGIPLK